jgi:hypothetical protein
MKKLFEEKWCMQVNRSYAEEPEYIIGRKKKICQLFNDMERDPNHFTETMKIEDKLHEEPILSIKGGRFGYVPGQNVPITAVATYKISKSIPESKSGGFIFLKSIITVVVLLFGIFVMTSIFASLDVKKGVEIIDDMSQECHVVTKEGHPVSITVFGETLFYDKNDEIIIPDQREITNMDSHRFERPFKYCSIVAIDGVKPII